MPWFLFIMFLKPSVFPIFLIERSKQISNQKPLLSTWYIIHFKYYFLKKQSHQSELRLKSSLIPLFKVNLWDKNVVLYKNYFIFSLVNDKNLYTDINSVLSTSAKETERLLHKQYNFAICFVILVKISS